MLVKARLAGQLHRQAQSSTDQQSLIAAWPTLAAAEAAKAAA